MTEKEFDLTQGGYFVIAEGLGFPVTQKIFIPEDFSDDQKMMAEMSQEFLREKVLSQIANIDEQKGNFELTIQILKEAAGLGLLGIDVAEKYGGANLDLLMMTLISEKLGAGGSWTVSWAVHVGIGSHPLILLGTEKQKEKYLAKITSGECFTAFAATEPGAGSDLFSIKTKATLMEDGENYLLNGEKIFISNAGFAHLFTVLAIVDGQRDQTVCFLVEADTPGLTVGKEENKMGIVGSSTCSLILKDVKVPKENLLGEIGGGLHIILNILNLGRLELAAITVGVNKHLITQSTRYALKRKQFNSRIIDFGLIKQKLVQMVVQTWMTESAVYRITKLMEEKLASADSDQPQEILNALREYEIECALLKVAGTENLSSAADKNLQIHGGYGYMKDYPAWRFYVDSKINEIFEGTNEINRLAAILTLLKKAGQNKLPLVTVIQNLVQQLDEISSPEIGDQPLASQTAIINNAKKMFLFAAGITYQKLGHDKEKLMSEQEILGKMADMMLRIFLAESGLLRAQQTSEEMHGIIVTIYAQETILEIEKLAKEILSSLEQGDMLKSYLSRLKRLTRYDLVNTTALGRKIVDQLIEQEKYFL
ncbi:acyl-CoA dehydrogenase family protein [Patescibacteria group bacterium]|nr:acyl-CoA dehydrogenase family protein [Patescibacteria group bacterium]